MKLHYSPRRARRSMAAGLALLLILFIVIQPALSSASGRKPFLSPGKTAQQTRQDKVRKVPPRPPERGVPANLPNLDEVRQRRPAEPVIPAPIESTLKARRKSTAPKERKKSNHRRSRNHARTNSRDRIAANPAPPQSGPPSFTDDPLKDPNNPESFKVKAIHITELRDAINTVRNRHHFPPKSWQKPQASSGAINTNVLISWEPIQEMRDALDQAIGPPPNGYAADLAFGLPILAAHITELRERVKGILGSSSITNQLEPARIDPFNQSGNPIQARDAEWSLPLISLPGRAGLDLGIGLTYSSLVWTQAGSYISFDDDSGDPSPGFRLGFPTIQGSYTNNLIGRNVYLFITAAGRRVELRRIGTTNIYESGDSSYLQLIDYGTSLLLRTTNGTQMSYSKFGSDWHCTQIEDRNGNLILANYNSFGDITDVTDTLGRVFTFNYDTNGNLLTITQPWTVNGSTQTHTWATFGWGTKTIHPAFSGVELVGIYSDETIPVLTQVGLPDGSQYNFEYNSRGQVTYIRRNSTIDLAYMKYEYDSPSADCPRITAARVWANNWSDVGNIPHEVPTYFADNQNGSHQMTSPDGTIYKEFYGGSGDLPAWQHGLVTSTQVLTGSTIQKTTTIAYTQDNTGVDYQTNPRVSQTLVSDGTNNRKTTIDYSNEAYRQYGLPYFVSEYAANGTTEIRRAYTDYDLSQPYLDRRIIGLVSAVHLVDVTNGWQPQSKLTYGYDDPARLSTQATTAVGHDQSYNSSFTVRGNVTSVSRWDIDNINTTSTTTTMNYDAAGSLVSTSDPLGHVNQISYVDKFSTDGVNLDAPRSFSTFAYPSSVTDADEFSSSVWYNYDFAAQMRTQGPPPQSQSNGVIQTFAYDGAIRLKQVTTVNTGAYVHHDYGPDYISTFASVNNVAPNYWQSDMYTNRFFDGLGRLFAAASNHPGSDAGGKAQYTRYDQMGRAVQQTNPFEIDSGWNPAGDDNAGYQFNVANTFDWKGRPLKTYNMDGTYKEASYAGCGCAGGEVVTLTDEVDRQQKIYSDVLGRTVKTELLNWAGGSVYSTTTARYNALDQTIRIRQYSGQSPAPEPENEGSGYETTTMDYDGYGRLWKKHEPEQQANPNHSSSSDHTTWTYNSDDSLVEVKDARGATATYTYNNNRHLVNEIHYGAPSDVGITPTTDVTFGYDAARNRTSMTDGTGNSTYTYDSMSRMLTETRQFTGSGAPSGDFTLAYQYNFANQVKHVTDQRSGTSFATSYDNVGRVTAVSAVGYESASTSFISEMKYRAWDALKSASHGNTTTLSLGYNSRLMVAAYSEATVGASYQYYADGRIKFAQDQSYNPEDMKDRAYQYDHAGRIAEAYSGTQARDFMNNTTVGTEDGPFRKTYAYSVWGNMLSESGRFWSRPVTTTGSYNSANRNTAWSYDEEGNVTSRNDGVSIFQAAQYAYDAAGESVSSSQSSTYYSSGWITRVTTNSQTYDGDGQLAKTANVINTYSNQTLQNTVANIGYQIRSTVLGGVVISEYNEQGTWQRMHVYAGSQRVGQVTKGENEPLRMWRHVDPVSGDELNTTGIGYWFGRTLLDPQGVNMGDSDPFPTDGSGDPDGILPATGPAEKSTPGLMAIEGGGARCVLDGIEMDCGFVRGWSTQQCPDAGCGPQVGKDGHLTQPFQAFADGGYGFLPQGAIYEGGGRWFIYGGNRDNALGKRRKERPEDGNYGVRRNHATPQNGNPNWPPPRPSDKLHDLDDCHFLAATADELAKNSSSDTSFVKAFAKRFVTPSNQDSPEMREFRADYFRSEFHDDQGSYNQVRHFVGGFSNAYYGALVVRVGFFDFPEAGFRSAVAEALRRANLREGPEETGDRNLNGVAVPMGVKLAFGKIKRTDVGNLIRSEVCVPQAVVH